MKNKRETLQAKISDWAIFVLGWALLGFQAYKYFTGALEEAVNYPLEIGIFVAGIMFVWKPQSLVNLISSVAKRKADGL